MAGIVNPRESVPRSKSVLVEKEKLIPSVIPLHEHTTPWPTLTLSESRWEEPSQQLTSPWQPRAVFQFCPSCGAWRISCHQTGGLPWPSSTRRAWRVHLGTGRWSSSQIYNLVNRSVAKTPLVMQHPFPKPMSHGLWSEAWLVGGPLHGSGGLSPHPSLGWPLWATLSSPIKGED